MFPRRERLSRSSLEEVLKIGKRRSSPHFSVVLTSGTRGSAVIVPKKVARLSVTRHRIKRRVLAALGSLDGVPTSVIFPKAEVKNMEYAEIQRELQKLLS